MPKRTNLLANLRVDIPDLENATHTYTSGTFDLHWNKFIQDNLPRIAEGFRVEVADQSTNPGEISVYNGIAFNRDGRILNNEDDPNATRSTILSPSTTTFYLEVEYITTESDVDSRAFWDPVYNNGTDPSGDLRLPGREFNQNVATRVTPDWNIVSPVSTSDFELNTNANSTKIPIAIISTDGGGLITGVSTAPARSTVLVDAAATDTSLSVVNSRLMPDAFQMTVGLGLGTSETVSVTANDRVNNILTIAGPGLANLHNKGERLVVADVTPAQFVLERTIMDPVLPTTNDDARPRFWQGNEERGYVYGQDPSANTGEGDVQISTLKEYIDFVAGQVRELKYGSARNADVGDIAPPDTFVLEPRYFERAGGVLGARTNTVSVGDGVSSWGDFNTTQSGSAQAAIQAAIDHLPSTGGTIYIKQGTYDITTTALNFNEPCTVIGDGRENTIIRATDAGGTVAANIAEDDIYMRDLAFQVNTGGVATATHAVTVTGTINRAGFRNMEIQGLSAGAFPLLDAVFENCDISAPSTGDVALEGPISGSTWINCRFTTNNTGAAGRCVELNTAGDRNRFFGCFFGSYSGNTAVVTLSGGIARTTFDSCYFSDTGTGPTAVEISGTTVSSVRIHNCDSVLGAGLGDFSDVTWVWITNSRVTIAADQIGADFSGATTGVHVTDCMFIQSATAAPTLGAGLNFTAATNVRVSGCRFQDTDSCITFTSLQDFNISDCRFETPTASRGRAGIRAIGTWTLSNGSITGFNMIDIDGAVITANIAGILLDTGVGSSTLNKVLIDNCVFDTIGHSGITIASAIRIDLNGGIPNHLTITNCLIDTVDANNTAAGIYVARSDKLTVSECSIKDVGNSNVGVWWGVRAVIGNNISISNNRFNQLGNAAAAPASLNNGAVVVGDSGGALGTTVVSINNNTILGLVNGNPFGGILIDEDARYTNISNNVMDISDSDCNPIFIDAQNTVRDATDLTINNNVLRGNFATGIRVLQGVNVALDEGRVCIVGNAIEGFEAQGIWVTGEDAGAGDTASYVISNNVLQSPENGIYGIRTQDLSRFVINGNSIYLTGTTGASYGIDCSEIGTGTSAIGVIGCNLIQVAANGATRGIDTEGISDVNVCGNYVNVSGVSAGTGYGLFLDSSMFAAGNYIVNSGGAGGDIFNNSPGNTFTNAREDADNAAEPPGVYDENLIGLNRRPN